MSTLITKFVSKCVLAWGNGNVSATTTTRYMSPWFEDGVAPTSPVQYRVPFAGRVKNMRVRVNSPAGNGNAVVYTFRVNSVASTLAVSLASTSSDGSDTANTVTLAAGDLLDIEVTKAVSVGAAPVDLECTIELDAT